MIKINITSTVFTPFVKEADPNITVGQLIEQLKQHYAQPISTKFNGKFIPPMDMSKPLGMYFQDGCTLEVNKGFVVAGPPQPQFTPQQGNAPGQFQPTQFTPQKFTPQINPVQPQMQQPYQGQQQFPLSGPQLQKVQIQPSQQNFTPTQIQTIGNNSTLVQQSTIRPIQNVSAKELEQAKAKISEQDDSIFQLEEQVTKLTKEIQRLKGESGDLDEAQRKIKQLQQELDDAESKQTKVKMQQQVQIQDLERKIRQLEEEKEDLINDLNLRSQQLAKARQGAGQQDTSSSSDKQYLVDEIDSLKNKNLRLQKFVDSLREKDSQGGQQVDISELTQYEQQIEVLTKERDTEHNNLIKTLDEKAELNRKIRDYQQKQKEDEQAIETQKQLRLKDKEQIDQLNKKLEKYKEELEYAEQYNKILQNQNEDLKSKVKVEFQPDNSKMEELNRQRQQKQREKQQQEEQLKREEALRLEEQKQKQKLRDQNLDQVMNKTKEDRNNLAKNLKANFHNSHGIMETCFLVDVTGSMDPYKEQTKQSVNGSMAKIKEATGRDSNWACIAYQDKAEFKQRGNLYQQIDFTNKPAEITEFLSAVKCEGGGDVAEDLQGGMEQMLKLKWTKQFKMCICITDSPCHGKLYNNGCSDNHKDDDIKPTIEKLADNDILLIGINFTENTRIMYQKISEIYKSKNKGEMCIIVNMDKVAQGTIWEEMVKLITEGAAGATQTNKSATKSKKAGPVVEKTKDGAMEGLCKKGNFMEFQTSVPVVECTLEVFRVELQEQAFEDNIEKIHKIDNKFYQPFKEGKWECTRTAGPFAFGMMKAVYLMKKRNDTSNQLYVIKMPLDGTVYGTLDQAISECRSHLICKQLMRKFMKSLREETQKQGKGINYPDIQYSDFLILKEIQGAKEVFWIAERFFKGEFRKYNNNNGYINDATDMHNRLSQAFTYYSYWVSNFDFMVNDVQGVSNYFTDPALNTNKGDFDETDIGADGQAMFMVNFEAKKDLCKDILDTLGIYPNE